MNLNPVSRPCPTLPPAALLLVLVLLCQCAGPPRPSGPEPLPGAGAHAARWTRVTAKLARAAPSDDRGKMVTWQFSLRDARGVNARSWPDGRVEVNCGTLPFVLNDGELAAVVAHEMAHVTGGHHRRQIAESWGNLVTGAALAVVASRQGRETGSAAALAAGSVLTVNLTALAARRRARETEADRISLGMMRLAGYPPQAAVDFWERYSATRLAHGHSSGHWWQSHPADSERIRRLRLMVAAR